jgi:hypothetical protein
MQLVRAQALEALVAENERSHDSRMSPAGSCSGLVPLDSRDRRVFAQGHHGDLSPGPAGGVLNQVNWEGTATGFGAVFGTATYAGGPKGGTYSWCAEAFLDNGNALTGGGPGTFESVGKHRWRKKGYTDISDSRRIVGEGEIDLVSRSWKGTIFQIGQADS